MDFDEFFGGVGRGQRRNRLDCYRDPDPGFLNLRSKVKCQGRRESALLRVPVL